MLVSKRGTGTGAAAKVEVGTAKVGAAAAKQQVVRVAAEVVADVPLQDAFPHWWW